MGVPMKTALWILGGLLAADLLFLSWFYVIRADYYFPGRYEDAFAASLDSVCSVAPW